MEPLPEAMKACEFCHELEGGSARLMELPATTVARRVFRSPVPDLRFIADASPLLAGHALLVPTRHASRFSLCNHESLGVALDELRKTVRHEDRLVFFEHGGISCLRNGACSEHAHMHVMTVPEVSMRDLLSTIRRRGGSYSGRYRSPGPVYRRVLDAGRLEYLVLGVASAGSIDVREVGFDVIESQILRTVVAECLGIEPHIADLGKRAAAVVATCNALHENFALAAPIETGDPGESEHERVSFKEECLDCRHDCVRRIARTAVSP